MEKSSEISLTNIGKILVKQFQLLEKSYQHLLREADFWNEHDVSSIPDEMLFRIPELGNYKIIRSGRGELLKHLKFFCSTILDSHFVKVISSILLPEFANSIVEVSRNVKVSMILSREVIETFKKDYCYQMSVLVKNRSTIYSIEDLRLLCIITDSAVCLGLYLNNGEFDVRCGLISTERSAIKWGIDLFDKLRERSTVFSS